MPWTHESPVTERKELIRTKRQLWGSRQDGPQSIVGSGSLYTLGSCRMAKILSSMCVFAGRLNPKTVDDSVDWRGIERGTLGCMCSTSLVRFLHKMVSANDFVQLFLCFFHHVRMPNELHHCPLYCAWSGICAGPKNVLNFNFSCSWSQSSCHCPHKHTIYNNVYMEAWISTLMNPLWGLSQLWMCIVLWSNHWHHSQSGITAAYSTLNHRFDIEIVE